MQRLCFDIKHRSMKIFLIFILHTHIILTLSIECLTNALCEYIARSILPVKLDIHLANEHRTNNERKRSDIRVRVLKSFVIFLNCEH